MSVMNHSQYGLASIDYCTILVIWFDTQSLFQPDSSRSKADT